MKFNNYGSTNAFLLELRVNNNDSLALHSQTAIWGIRVHFLLMIITSNCFLSTSMSCFPPWDDSCFENCIFGIVVQPPDTQQENSNQLATEQAITQSHLHSCINRPQV